jgi:hypothetical protein
MEPALRPLTDVFAIPSAVPLANVFSIGDVLIGLGLATAIALAMRPVGTRAGDAQRSSCAGPAPAVLRCTSD